MNALKIYLSKEGKVVLKKEQSFELYPDGRLNLTLTPHLPDDFDFLKDLNPDVWRAEEVYYPVLIARYDKSDLTASDMNRGSYEDSIDKPFYQNIYGNADMMWPLIHVVDKDYFAEDMKYDDIPRFIRLIDSSIWNHVHVDDSGQNPDSALVRLKDVLRQILTNYSNSRYSLQITHEYANFNYRIARESYLIGSHASGVSPYLFHSEMKMKKALANLKTRSVMVDNDRWRFLLVDDCAQSKSLSIVNQSEEAASVKSSSGLNPLGKLQIVKQQMEMCGFEVSWDVLDSSSPRLSEDQYKQVHISCVHTVDSAIEALKDDSVKYDIILLDYLLAPIGATGRMRYSYEILDRIMQDEALKASAGPNGRFFFMYMSAFTTAIQERLMERGLSRNEACWYIGQGACPTNNPHMFNYYLVNLMNKRVMDIKTDVLIEYLRNIFMSNSNVRDKVYESFGNFLALRSRYQKLKADIGCSRLVKSIYVDFDKYNKNFWDHLQHLLYMIAYGTVRQWPQMWEEYIFIRDAIKQADGQKTLCATMEEYIINLKGGRK